MQTPYDLLLKSGTLVDPVNQIKGPFDIAVADGKISEIASDISPTLSKAVFDLKGLHVVPGIIDLHIHVSLSASSHSPGHKMMAEAGVTTALDMSGPIETVLDGAREYGSGMNLACLHKIHPGYTVSGSDPDTRELEKLLVDSLQKGAIGLKIMGGHFPLTPEATARAVEVANQHGAYVAMHAGTTETKTNLEGFFQAVELAQGRYLHVAHINSYCRGLIRPYMDETEEAITVLEQNPNICSESYLSPINGTGGKCVNGVPESDVTRIWLAHGGFSPTEQGLEDAIREGWAQVNIEAGGGVVLDTGQEAVQWWRQKATDTNLSFVVNPPEPRFRLATAKRSAGKFVVDCISTDGGEIPRNVIVEMGLSLVKLKALTLEEFVMKTSRNPAKILSLDGKGHLGIGADADVTVIDLDRQSPYMGVASGRVIMYRGFVCGKGAQIVTTPAGETNVRENGLAPIVVDPAENPLCRRV